MPDRELQIFGQPCRWRETMRYPRALFCDARIVLFVGIAAVDISLRSVVLLASAMAVFLILEHMGMTVPAALRQLRTIGAGRSRRATSRPRREMVCHAGETVCGQWCPMRLASRSHPRWLSRQLARAAMIATVSSCLMTGMTADSAAVMVWEGLAGFYRDENAGHDLSRGNDDTGSGWATPLRSPGPFNPLLQESCPVNDDDISECIPVIHRTNVIQGSLDPLVVSSPFMDIPPD